MGIPITIEPPTPPALIAPADAYVASRAVSLGIPIGRDRLDTAHLRVRAGGGPAVDADVRVLGRWPDGDPKWVLATFPVPTAGAGPVTLSLEMGPGPAATGAKVATVEPSGEIVFRAGGLEFRVDPEPGPGLVARIDGAGGLDVSRPGVAALDVVARDDDGDAYVAHRDETWLAENGASRAVLVAKGRLVRADGAAGSLVHFVAELEFDRARPGPIVRLTLRNDDRDVKRNVKFDGLAIRGRFDSGGPGFAVRAPVPGGDGTGEWSGASEATILQGMTDGDVRGATSARFHGPETLGDGYWISSIASGGASFPPSQHPVSHWVVAGNGRVEAFGSIRHLDSYWGGFKAFTNGDLDVSLFAEAQGPHTMRFGSWETREALVLAGAPGSIRAAGEAFAFEYPRLARFDNPAVWNRSGAFPAPLASLEVREWTLDAIAGGHRDLRHCPDSPYRVRYHYAGTPGGSNQWDAANDYLFAWASTGDPNAWAIAEAWADYRTDRAVPHGGASDAVNAGSFGVTDDDELFDTGHRHSHFLPIWFFTTGQIRFDLAAHDELSTLYGSDRISARYMESRITSRLIELGALFQAFERDRGYPGADLLYPRIRDYVGTMLSLRWDFDDPAGSEGWANEPNRRDRDPRTFWAASPGKGDPLVDITFMVASLLPHGLRSWLEYAPPDDPHRETVEKRLVDLADFSWEYLILKSELPFYRGTLFEFDTRRGTPPPPSYGDPDFPDVAPDLYHPLYDAFTSAYETTGESRYLEAAAYWAAGQAIRGAPWVTFHRPDFQRFANRYARENR